MSVPTLTKQPSESRLYDFNFSGLLGATESITAITSITANPSGLTLSGQAIWVSAKGVQVRIAGGVAGSYKVTAIVTTDAGNTLEGEGVLNVYDK